MVTVQTALKSGKARIRRSRRTHFATELTVGATGLEPGVQRRTGIEIDVDIGAQFFPETRAVTVHG